MLGVLQSNVLNAIKLCFQMLNAKIFRTLGENALRTYIGTQIITQYTHTHTCIHICMCMCACTCECMHKLQNKDDKFKYF